MMRGPLAVVRAAGALVSLAALAACGSNAMLPAPAAVPVATAGSTAGPAPIQPPSPSASPGPAASQPGVLPTGIPAQFHVSRTTSVGPILQTTLAGPKSGVSGKVWVWLPPQYNDPQYATTRFPVLMLYTGNTGVDHNFWDEESVEPIQAQDVALMKDGRAHPFIMVMPVLQLSTRLDTECSDVGSEPKMGTWLADDVTDMVKADFRTLPSRDGWGLAGASSGGFCATKLALQHPDLFKAAVSWCGYFTPEPDAGPAWSPSDITANDPTDLITRHPDVRLFLLSGDNPRYSSDYERIRSFAKLVESPTTVQTYLQPGGGHFTSDLAKLLPQILEFLTENLAGPADRE